MLKKNEKFYLKTWVQGPKPATIRALFSSSTPHSLIVGTIYPLTSGGSGRVLWKMETTAEVVTPAYQHLAKCQSMYWYAFRK